MLLLLVMGSIYFWRRILIFIHEVHNHGKFIIKYICTMIVGKLKKYFVKTQLVQENVLIKNFDAM